MKWKKQNGSIFPIALKVGNNKPLPTLLIFFLGSVLMALGQTPLPNTLYLEGGGAGGFYSINYERLLFSKPPQWRVAARLGISSYHWRDFTRKVNPDVVLPAGIQGSYGNRHRLEVGLGHSFATLVKASKTDFTPQRSLTHHGYVLLGYRLQFRRWFLAAGYHPLWEWYRTWRHWGRLAVGYSFGKTTTADYE